MLKKRVYILSYYIIGFLFFSAISFAGSANLTIIHEKPDLKVVKYTVKYGTEPNTYVNEIDVIPEGGPIADQSTTRVDVGDGNSGYYYFSVKDFYEDGSESEFSESSLQLLIPKTTLNIRVVN